MKPVKVLFVIDHFTAQELCSIPILSAAVKQAGHKVALVEFCRNESKALDVIAAYAPDVVAYSICSNEAERMLTINSHLKKHFSFQAVFGGPHPTFFPVFIQEHGVDAICRGEGDIVFPQLLSALGTETMFQVPNFIFRMPDHTIRENPLTDLIPDLDALPFPDRDIIYQQNKFQALSPVKAFYSGRGCPFNCTYCFNHAYHSLYRGKGRVIRVKSIKRLIEEIRYVMRNYPLTFVKFNDDVFGSDIHWLEEFAAVYPQEIGLPFTCLVRPNMVTAQYARLLKQAGCFSTVTAIEAGNEEIRKTILKRNISDQQIIAACMYLREQKINIYSANMLGLPGETEADMIRTIKLNQQARVSYADASIFQPYPGTEITAYCEEHGLLASGKTSLSSLLATSSLNISQELKTKIDVLRSMFAMIVDYPWLLRIYPLLVKLRFLHPFLNFAYRLYYGIFNHRRILASKIPWHVRLRAATIILFSKSRA